MIPPETILHAQSSVGIATLNATVKFGLSPDGERVVSRELSDVSFELSDVSFQFSDVHCGVDGAEAVECLFWHP